MALFGLLGSKNNDGKRRITSQQARSVLAYTHLPGIIPRIRALGGKFGHFAFLLALIYRSARLLPPGHPMTNPANIGRFGIRDVMATAANGLTMKRDNMDQILIFGAVAAALIMILIQAVLIAVYAFLGATQAEAQENIFVTKEVSTDLAFTFLRQVFGVEKIFGNAEVIHTGFHAILGFYSTAMMIIAVIIVVYYVITIVGESAQTGTPFGKRFNGLWAPIRLVLALGLLVPLGGGLNAAQYLTLYTAKFGSSLATNAWIKFSDKFNQMDPSKTMAAQAPSIQGLGNIIYNAEACRALYNAMFPNGPKVNLLYEYQGKSYEGTLTTADTTGKRGAIRYVWTKQDKGGAITESTCGGITMQITEALTTGSDYAKAVRALEVTFQSAYLNSLAEMRNGFTGANGTTEASNDSAAGMFKQKFQTTGTGALPAAKRDEIKISAIAAKVAGIINTAQGKVNQTISSTDTSSASQIQSLKKTIVDTMKADAKKRGWAGAGSFYMEISRVTQGMKDAAKKSFPSATEAPTGDTAQISTVGWFSWLSSSDKRELAANEKVIITGMNALPEIVRQASAQVTPPTPVKTDNPQKETFSSQFALSNPILYLARFLFGDALLKLMDTPDLNPMERFIEAGSYILDRSENMVYAYGLGRIAALAATQPLVGPAAIPAAALATGVGAGVASNSFANGAMWGGMVLLAGYVPSIVMFFILMGVVAGILLFYVLPMLPFMIFFFSVVNWVIEVAEAFIAAPLFALSHLRIDGEGLPGQTAYAGWLTLFGVMIRPVLIVVGLIVSSLIFGAASYFLASVFRQAVFSYRDQQAGTGWLDLSTLGQFGILFYVLMFVYILYILANSTFKLIDMIPDKALRWIGGQQPFTGDRPVELSNFQALAVAGYGALTQAQNATGGAMKEIGEQFKGKGKDNKPTTNTK